MVTAVKAAMTLLADDGVQSPHLVPLLLDAGVPPVEALLVQTRLWERDPHRGAAGSVGGLLDVMLLPPRLFRLSLLPQPPPPPLHLSAGVAPGLR